MKNKIFVFLAIITTVGIVFTFNHATGSDLQRDVKPQEGEKFYRPVEYSNFRDRQAIPGGDDIDGLMPEQGLCSWPVPDPPGNGYPANAIYYFDAGTPVDSVDAEANVWDLFFEEVKSDKVDLLLSFLGDPLFMGVGPQRAVYREGPGPGGQRVPFWDQSDLNFGNGPGELEDLDALQIWGGDCYYANCYSKQGDPAVGGIKYSVYIWWNPGGGPAGHLIAYVRHSNIVSAIRSAALDTLTNQGHYTGDSLLVDLDGLMVKNTNVDSIWNAGDTIIFSIRAAGNWDGGEIVVLPFGGPPSYLFHGGHRWNTAFNVQATFQVNTEEVDAIEAYWSGPYYWETPTLTQWGLIILVALLIASTIFILIKRRKAVVTLR
jgi:hypothetical protein